MIVNFYEEVRRDIAEQKKCPYEASVVEAKKLVEQYSKDDRAKIAYHLNRWEWDEDILGKFPGYAIAWGYAKIFSAFVSKYNRFKYECMFVNGMTEEEFREAVIAEIYNAVLR